MEENTNRGVFALNGVTGMLIATVLLLSILAGLTCWGISAQQGVMQKPYTFKDAEKVKEFGSNPKQHIIINDLAASQDAETQAKDAE